MQENLTNYEKLQRDLAIAKVIERKASSDLRNELKIKDNEREKRLKEEIKKLRVKRQVAR